MFGVIAWIRADGRKALVVVEGSPQMAAGDPGLTQGQGLTVGDLVFLPALSQDNTVFGAGLTLVRSEFWPKIRHHIFQMATANLPASADKAGNVISLFAPRDETPPHRRNRRIVAAE